MEWIPPRLVTTVRARLLLPAVIAASMFVTTHVTAAPSPAPGVDAVRMVRVTNAFLKTSIVLGGGGKAVCPQISRINRSWGMTIAGDGNQGATIYLVRPSRSSHRWLVWGWESAGVPRPVASEFTRPAPCAAAPWTIPAG